MKNIKIQKIEFSYQAQCGFNRISSLHTFEAIKILKMYLHKSYLQKEMHKKGVFFFLGGGTKITKIRATKEGY